MLELWIQWFRQEGWVVCLACLNLVLVVRLLFWTAHIKRVAWRLEAKYQGFQERLRYAIDKADISMKHVRRLTDEFSPMPVEEPKSDPNADTHIRELPEP